MLFPGAQIRLGLYQPLDHPHVVQHGHVVRGAEHDGAGDRGAVPDQLPVDRTVGVDDLGDVAVTRPVAETGALQAAHVQDVDQQASGILHVLAGHVRARDPAVVDRGGLNGVHRLTAGGQIRSLGHVPRRIHVGRTGLAPVVDQDALVGLDARSREKADIGPDPRGDDNHVRAGGRPIGKLQGLHAVVAVIDGLHAHAGVDFDPLGLEPGAHQGCALGVQHAGQHLVFQFDHLQAGAALVHRVEDDESDEPGPDEGHLGIASQGVHGLFRVGHRPEIMDAVAVRAGYVQLLGGRSRGDQQVVEGHHGSVAEREHARVGIHLGDTDPEAGLHPQPAEIVVVSRIHLLDRDVS